jgi:hypothetical protein
MFKISCARISNAEAVGHGQNYSDWSTAEDYNLKIWKKKQNENLTFKKQPPPRKNKAWNWGHNSLQGK